MAEPNKPMTQSGSGPETFTGIPEPLQRADNPANALVENIYPVTGVSPSVPDHSSLDNAALYLKRRLLDENRPTYRWALTETGRVWPRIGVTGVRAVSSMHIRRTDGYVVSPWASAAIAVGSLVMSVAPTAAADLGDEVRQGGHAIYRLFNPVESHLTTQVETQRIPGPTNLLEATSPASSRVGVGEVDPRPIADFVAQLKASVDKGGKVHVINVVGRASDEQGNDSTIGVAEPAGSLNAELSDARGAQATRYLVKDLKLAGLYDSVAIVTSSEQSVLDERQVDRLRRQAEAANYESITQAIQAVDHGDLAKGDLQADIQTNVVDQRGAVMSASVETDGEGTVLRTYQTTETQGKDDPPSNPDRDYSPWLIPIPPIRRRELASEARSRRRWGIIPGFKKYKPQLLREDQDHVWVRVRPETIQNNNTLREQPWADTDKFRHLMRDGRIVDMLRADSTDEKGDVKSLRIMFVDKSPSDETVEAFSHLLKKFMAIPGLAEKFSAIMVYPSSNAGTSHNDPKRIGLGVDKQSRKGVLGTCTPVLELVELHMDETWKPSDVEGVMGEYMGPAWVLAHETAGHGSDSSDEKLRLVRTRGAGVSNAHVIAGDSWKHSAAAVHAATLDPNDKTVPTQFNIAYPVIDRSGNVTTMKAQVYEGDPRLSHATSVTIVNRRPTRYGATSELEHHAEGAASVATGIEIPFEEAAVFVPSHISDDGARANFARGYHPASQTQRVVAKAMGARQGTIPAEMIDQPEVVITRDRPENDSLMQRLYRRARMEPILPRRKMISILARTTASRSR